MGLFVKKKKAHEVIRLAQKVFLFRAKMLRNYHRVSKVILWLYRLLRIG